VDIEELQFLLSGEGQILLAETAEPPITPETHLELASRLRNQIGPKRTHAILETTLLRQQATAKFTRATEMYFTRDGLEQASAEIVAKYRLGRYIEAGFDTVADLGCGIGGDSLVLASQMEVYGVDWDPIRLAMAQENVHVYGHGGRFRPLQADLLALSPLPVEAVFADPGRRDEHGRRIYSVHDYRPPLSFLDGWREAIPHLGVKIGPGVDYEELPPEAEIEFISVRGEVREGVLWYGELRSKADRRATLLPGRETLTDEAVIEIPVTQPSAYLYEPDGAVIRAHLVEQLAQQLGARKIDPSIAYLTAEDLIRTPFARPYYLEDVFPFQLKRLRQYLRERNIGQVTIKKRGSPLDPDVLRKRLRLEGAEHRVVFLTQVMGSPMVLIGQEVSG
jgi:SAM-dependent methyltransferase